MFDETGSLNITFTGKAVLLFETNVGPFEFKTNDFDTVKEIIRIVVDDGIRTTVGAYSDEEKITMQTLLNSIDDLSSDDAND